MDTTISPIERAIEMAGGSESKLAKAVRLSQPLIHKARKTGAIGPKLAPRNPLVHPRQNSGI
jgi:hypothetical protein